MASEESVNKAIAAVVAEVRAYYGEDLQRFSIEPGQGTDAPYQVLMRGDELPLAGLAQVPAQGETKGAANAAKRDGRSGSAS